MTYNNKINFHNKRKHNLFLNRDVTSIITYKSTLQLFRTTVGISVIGINLTDYGRVYFISLGFTNGQNKTTLKLLEKSEEQFIIIQLLLFP